MIVRKSGGRAAVPCVPQRVFHEDCAPTVHVAVYRCRLRFLICQSLSLALSDLSIAVACAF